MISYSDTALTISETLQTNAIVWIHSLPDGEMGPSRRILEDLEALANFGGFPLFEYAVRDRAGLGDIFKQLRAEAEQGLRPVLHLMPTELWQTGFCLLRVANASAGLTSSNSFAA